jgi:hypothetical protein
MCASAREIQFLREESREIGVGIFLVTLTSRAPNKNAFSLFMVVHSSIRCRFVFIFGG